MNWNDIKATVQDESMLIEIAKTRYAELSDPRQERAFLRERGLLDERKPCIVDECDKYRHGRGLCKYHYQRAIRHAVHVSRGLPNDEGTLILFALAPDKPIPGPAPQRPPTCIVDRCRVMTAQGCRDMCRTHYERMLTATKRTGLTWDEVIEGKERWARTVWHHGVPRMLRSYEDLDQALEADTPERNMDP